MKNRITDSYFVHDGVCTVVKNPSPLIHSLLNGISTRPFQKKKDNLFLYIHRDIGTMEEMEQLFLNLEKSIQN